MCGAHPTLGMDVHPGLKLSRERLQETADFLSDFLGAARMHRRRQAPRELPGQSRDRRGTGFTLVTEHIPEFTKRGLCARDPKRAQADGIAMRVPRMRQERRRVQALFAGGDAPYAHRWRLFRTPNDAFLTANTHREGMLAVRHPAAGLCGALQRRDPPHRRGACDRRRPRGARTCARSWTSRRRSRAWPRARRTERGRGALLGQRARPPQPLANPLLTSPRRRRRCAAPRSRPAELRLVERVA